MSVAGIIAWSLRQRVLVLVIACMLTGLGIRAVFTTPMDAIPDLNENQVIVFADWPGRSPQEIEDQITQPLSSQLRGLAAVRTVRATSMFGFSLLTVVFEDGVDLYFARARVQERLSTLAPRWPAGVAPQLGPDATGLGWVFQYYLHVDPARGGSDLGALRTIQDTYLRPALGSVSGVAEVAGIGGFARQWQVEVSSAKMRAAGVSLQAVLESVAASNLNVGGKTLEENGQEFVLRGIGLLRNADDLRQIVVAAGEGGSVTLGALAEIQLGGDYRRGALDVDGREVVGGVIVMRSGANARETIAAVKGKLAEIAPGLEALAPGVTVRPFYDRSVLIQRSVATLRRALLEEILLVTLVHIIFLAHFRSIAAATLPLPISILCAFALMQATDITSNIMSLAGLAIAIGVLVDAAIVIVENVIRQSELREHFLGRALTMEERGQVTLAATLQVGRPVFFSMIIVLLAFVPVFGLSGAEGKLFHPLAFTKTFAMAASTLLAITLVPVLCVLLVRGPFQSEERNPAMRLLLRLYEPTLNWSLRHPRSVCTAAAALLTIALVCACGLPGPVAGWFADRGLPALGRGFGSEFMPPLNEGSLLQMPVLLPSTAFSEVKKIVAWQDAALREVPEVLSAAGKFGRADTATDPAPVEMIETTLTLRPENEWRPGLTRDRLIAELTAKLARLPGYVPGFLQPIEGRILMISTGVRAQLGIKIFGDDPAALQAKALEIEALLRTIPGSMGVVAARSQSKPFLEIEVDRLALVRSGLRVEDVLRVVEAGLGGANVTTVIDGRQRVPVQVRLQHSERDDLTRLGDVLVATPLGAHLPLRQLASIRRQLGPNEIISENGRLCAVVQCNVRDRDLGGFVSTARQRIAANLVLGPGMTLGWSGQYEHQLHAEQTLQIIIPIVLVIIFLLLTAVYRSAREAAHILLAVPCALTGGVFLQKALGYPMSVAVWVGYIVLFGIAIQTAVVMVIYLDEAVSAATRARGNALTRAELLAAVRDGARLRLRPKVMTGLTIIASLFPIMWTREPGAEIMRPLAAPVLGGMISSFLHILVLTPTIFYLIRARHLSGS